MTGSIYNTTDGPLLIDRAGRVLGARERLDDVDVTASPVAGHIDAGRLVVIDEQPDAAVEAKASRRRQTPAPSTEEA